MASITKSLQETFFETRLHININSMTKICCELS